MRNAAVPISSRAVGITDTAAKTWRAPMRFWFGTFAALLTAAPVMGIVVTAADETQKVVEATVGETLILRLRSSPGTGFTWQVASIDTEHLTMPEKPTYEAPQTPALGASGYQVFKFLLQKPGSAHVILHYRRPWEEGREPARSFDLEIAIRPEKPGS